MPDLSNGAVDFPIAHYNMTPNMVAGVLTTAYAEAADATDHLVTAPVGDTPPLDCAELVGSSKKNIFPFNTFFMLNPESPGVGQSLAIGSFFSNTTSGTNYQLSDWLCSAPNAPFQLTVSEVGNPQPQTIEVTDTYNTAAGTFTTAPTNSPFWNTLTPPSQWPFKSCQATSQFPTLSAGQASGYKPADTPALQAVSISTYGTGSNLAFGAMDWSDASYNGLNVASLQNASGNFVAPTQQSIDSALDDATANINGVLTFNYDDNSNTTMYPMPMVTYAVVPTTPLPSAQAQTETKFLTNLVDVSSGKVGTLPGGYVPLTSDLATQALQDISTDIVAEPSNAPATVDGRQLHQSDRSRRAPPVGRAGHRAEKTPTTPSRRTRSAPPRRRPPTAHPRAPVPPPTARPRRPPGAPAWCRWPAWPFWWPIRASYCRY